MTRSSLALLAILLPYRLRCLCSIGSQLTVAKLPRLTRSWAKLISIKFLSPAMGMADAAPFLAEYFQAHRGNTYVKVN
ncbi:hypothetical protein GGS26DRAFT_555522 [Hypomontagnella submonticulosa]|nr:hypothetical protein GGS26DRAFT_555522 [Hypomontagnella submonticulosa]